MYYSQWLIGFLCHGSIEMCLWKRHIFFERQRKNLIFLKLGNRFTICIRITKDFINKIGTDAAELPVSQTNNTGILGFPKFDTFCWHWWSQTSPWVTGRFNIEYLKVSECPCILNQLFMEIVHNLYSVLASTILHPSCGGWRIIVSWLTAVCY